jgi:hypothetical protein
MIFKKKSRSVMPIVGPKQPLKRLTITPCVIQSAKTTFLFAQGKEKGCVLSKGLEQPNDFETIPVRLVIASTWILDTDAAEERNKINHKTKSSWFVDDVDYDDTFLGWNPPVIFYFPLQLLLTDLRSL